MELQQQALPGRLALRRRQAVIAVLCAPCCDGIRGEAGQDAYSGTLFAAAATINSNDSTYDARYLVVSNTTVTLNGAHAFGGVGIFGTGVVSREVEQKTIVYLLTRPVARWRILLMRYLAAVTAITLTVWLATGLLAVLWLLPALAIAAVILAAAWHVPQYEMTIAVAVAAFFGSFASATTAACFFMSASTASWPAGRPAVG